MSDTCVICTSVLPEAKAVLKCGHSFCSECIMDNIALNTGTEEGTSRNKCPMCRAPCCHEVLPSVAVTIHMDNLTDDVQRLEEELTIATDDNEFYVAEINILRRQNETLSKELGSYTEIAEVERFTSAIRLNTIKRMRIDAQIAIRSLYEYRVSGRHYPVTLMRIYEKFQHILIPESMVRPIPPNGYQSQLATAPVAPVLRRDPLPTPPLPPTPVDQAASTIASPEVTIHSAAQRFFRLAYNIDVPSDSGGFLPIQEHNLPASETSILTRIVRRLQNIEKEISTDLTQWWTDRGGVIDDKFLPYNSGTEEYLILGEENIKYITGIKVGDILSKYGHVKKYQNEPVNSQRKRLAKVWKLRDELGETDEFRLKVGWTTDKIPQFMMG